MTLLVIETPVYGAGLEDTRGTRPWTLLPDLAGSSITRRGRSLRLTEADDRHLLFAVTRNLHVIYIGRALYRVQIRLA